MRSIQNLKSFGIAYVDTRTNQTDEMKQFAEQVFGYKKTHDCGGLVAFTMLHGQRFELHTESTLGRQSYSLDSVVAGFEVLNMNAATAWAECKDLAPKWANKIVAK